MEIEKLKARIDEIAAKKMIRDSANTIRRDADAKWFWRFCKFCGDFYNRKLEPWSVDGATPSYCGKRCVETAHEIAKATKISNHTRAAKAKPGRVKASSDKVRRLRVLARWFGKDRFSFRDASRALRLNDKSTQVHVKEMASIGWLIRLEEVGPNGRSYYRLSDHEEAVKALRWAEMKEGGGA